MESTYFRRGFGLKAEIEGQLTADYHSAVVEALRARQYRLDVGPLTFRLAREFGFCYGVDRAVDYAYETRRKFPDRRALPGRRDHPQPARQPEAARHGRAVPRAGRRTASSTSPAIGPEDVVILPAFGVTMGDFERLRAIGCVLVDTTCGSVLNVWKRVESYARDGFTALIHGKHYHEETKATASQVMKYPGRPLPRRAQHGRGADRLRLHRARRRRGGARRRGSPGRSRRASISSATCSGWASPTRRRCSRASRWRSREEVRRSMERRYGAEAVARALPDVRHDLLRHAGAAGRGAGAARGAARRDGGGGRLQLEQHLPPRRAGAVEGRAARSTSRTPTASTRPRARSATSRSAPSTRSTPPAGSATAAIIGITAGASTPNNKVGETIARICALAGVAEELRAQTG